MYRWRALDAVTRALLAAVLLVTGGPLISSTSADALRLVDREGVMHLTNVPADPRYQGVPGASGTSSGWLRLPERPWGRYLGEIRDIARQYDVDPVLVEAVVRTESAFDATAVSPKGAAGLMQLMPATATALGVLDRFDPRENIRGGVRHLRYLLDRYQGNVALALAAYNAGERAVDAYGGIPPYQETQEYVQRVLRRAGLTESPGRSPQGIYRYPGPDDTLTYSNLPPVLLR